MSKLDDALAHHSRVWHSVARYSLYQSTWSPKKTYQVIETGLHIREAKDKAAVRQKAVGGVTFGGTMFGIQLENTDQANAAVRAADIWYDLER